MALMCVTCILSPVFALIWCLH